MAAGVYGINFIYEEKTYQLKISVSESSKDAFTDILAANDDVATKVRELIAHPLSLLPFFRPGDTVLDLGCNLGMFSLPLACIGYKVHAFDGSVKNILNLAQSAYHNGFKRYFTHNFAIADSEGYVKFYENGNTGYAEFGQRVSKEVDTDSYYMKSISLDNFPWISEPEKISMIKIDIEGSEVYGLNGMKKFLERAKFPPVFIEVNGFCLAKNGFIPNDIFRIFDEMGYNLYVHNITGKFVKFDKDWVLPWHLYDFLMTRETIGEEHLDTLFPNMGTHFISKFFELALDPMPEQRVYAAGMLLNSPYFLDHQWRQPYLDKFSVDPDPAVRAAVARPLTQR